MEEIDKKVTPKYITTVVRRYEDVIKQLLELKDDMEEIEEVQWYRNLNTIQKSLYNFYLNHKPNIFRLNKDKLPWCIISSVENEAKHIQLVDKVQDSLKNDHSIIIQME